jgi:tetratricopeptide (TPR) repeat protein
MRTRDSWLLATVLLATATVHAQADWATVTRGAEYAFASGQMARAETGFQQALEIAQTFPAGDRRLEVSLENLGRFYEHQSQFAKAQPLYQLLLAAQEYRVGPDDPALLNTLFIVARVSQPLGDLPTVESCLTRFDAIATASNRADPRQWWQVQAMLARMGIVQEDEAAALEWQRRAVEVLATDSNATSEERIIQLESLAQMELKAGEGDRAEQLYLQIAGYRAEEGEADAVPRTMASGAEAAYGAGEFDTAERLALRALDADPSPEAERTARTVLADVSWARVNRGTADLAVLLAAAGDSQDLELAGARTQALVALEGASNPDRLGRLVQIETLRGRTTEAAGWQRQLMESTGGGTTAMGLDLVTLLAAAGLTDEALAANQAVLSALEAEYGPSDARLEPVLGQRLNILIDAGRKKEARAVSKRLKKLTKE